MEPDPELPPSTPLGSIIPTAHDHQVEFFLNKAELSPPEPISILAALPVIDFESSLPSHSDEARSLLAQERINEPGYKDPKSQFHHKFRPKSRKEFKCNTDKWIFNKHEVAKAFSSLLSHAPLASPGTAQAVLSHASGSSLDELWCHLHDSKLEKRLKSRWRKSRSSTVPDIPWLDDVTSQENLAYIRLLCQAGLSQSVIDRAFSAALSKHSMEVMELLLGFGAVASGNQDAIRERVRLGDLHLVKLLLSVPNAMSVEAWRYCMEPQVESLEGSEKQPPIILLLCLSHRPDVVCRFLLLKALESQNLQATAVILAYASFDEDFRRDVRQAACELASRVQDDGRRLEFFTMLAESKLVADDLVLREELLKDVKTRHLPLIQLLTEAGISLDIEPCNALYWAVSHMDLETLEIFKNGTFSSDVSFALKFVPDSTSEQDMLRLVEVFAPMGLSGEPIDSHLVRAVRKQHVKLVDSLLRCGASVEFEQASAIRAALEKSDFNILNILLRMKCSPEILSTTIPTAMALKSRPSRLEAIKALLEKGILNQELGVPLQTLVAEDGEVDSELIQFFLWHKAPIDGVGIDANNAVLVAARRGNLSVLAMLCDAGPQDETLSKAIPVAFSAMHTCGYEVALNMMKLLLQTGAAGVPIHQTLLVAAKVDYRLDIVRLLVEYGAEANYAIGAPFNVALEAGNIKLLEILCRGCPPSRATMETVMYTAIDPRYYNMQALELLLSSTPSAGIALNTSWSSEKFKGNQNMTAILPCFLRYGLDVDLRNGAPLCFAIQEKNDILLNRILSANPNITSLTTAFRAATSVKPRKVELEMMRLLLVKAQSTEIGQSESLLQQTYAALAGDFAGLQLLLRHKAVVDYDDGRAIQAAAAAGSLKALDLLLLSGPSPFIINRACLAAASSSINLYQKQSVFEHLLAANGGLLTEDITKLLADSVATLPDHTQLPQLLLARRAEVKFETLKTALGTASRDVFVILAGSIHSANTIVSIFRHSRKITLPPDRRYWVYEYLLGRRIPSDDVSEALLDALKANDLGDLSFPKLLLQHGAAVGYKNGMAFSLALNSNSLDAIKLLSQFLADDKMAGIAFDLARKTVFLDPHVRMEVYRCLLQWNISKSSIRQALLENLKGGHSDISTVQLLLAKGADPNEDDAHCFVVASRAGVEPEFRALSKHAKLRVVLKALMDNFQEEWEVVWWFRVCLEEKPHSVTIDEDDLLFKCMRKFPRGTTLLRLLLDNGVSASPMIMESLCPGWQPELCTALIWAIFSQPRIENDAILLLLTQGADAALPAYSTPLTKVSAAFGCLLDKTRTPILKALLDLDGDLILDYVVPGSSFSYLGAYLNGSKKDSDLTNDLSLRAASLYLGNFDAFQLMKFEETPNDGTLHTAALLALPKFVQWLLDIHDANYKAEDFDNMIPLAIICKSKPHPWCKIANEELDWKTRQKQTMQLLAPRTSSKWRSSHKTVLHIALENGLETTKAMAEALDILNDPEKDEKYLYMDKDGIEYSPHQYVIRVMGADADEAKRLVEFLFSIGMKSRYFKRITHTGSQPTGYHGLPPELLADEKESISHYEETLRPSEEYRVDWGVS